ncbi:MAG TPA: NUDIX domain-containing protein [Puia sp.]|nr:NUDIX domain-containing protein [Puia sp.]
MQQPESLDQWLERAARDHLAHISLDCVVFGFHAGQLKILLLKMKHEDLRALPGGFVMNEETLEEAAIRVLRERTGLENVFLQQFHVFSDVSRSDPVRRPLGLQRAGISAEKAKFLAQRFISVGFYALVEFSKVVPRPDLLSDTCDWYSLEDRGPLILDHEHILQTALGALRAQLNRQPIGYNLLPRKFTLPELQKLYEAILGRTLDRRNFQRKIFSYGILRALDEKRTGVAHKAPYLYSWHLRKYQQALKDGLGGW